MYVIKTPETSATKKALGMFSKNIKIENNQVKGTFSVSGYRKYNYGEELDVEFNGIIHVKLGRKPYFWYGKEVVNESNVSKIKLNRFLKKSIYKELKRHTAYFGVNLRYYSEIKKIIWKH